MNTFPHTLLALTLARSMSPAWGAPIITQQPQDQTAIQGSTATFSVSATGTPLLHCQWRAYTTSTTFTNLHTSAHASDDLSAHGNRSLFDLFVTSSRKFGWKD